MLHFIPRSFLFGWLYVITRVPDAKHKKCAKRFGGIGGKMQEKWRKGLHIHLCWRLLSKPVSCMSFHTLYICLPHHWRKFLVMVTFINSSIIGVVTLLIKTPPVHRTKGFTEITIWFLYDILEMPGCGQYGARMWHIYLILWRVFFCPQDITVWC